MRKLIHALAACALAASAAAAQQPAPPPAEAPARPAPAPVITYEPAAPPARPAAPTAAKIERQVVPEEIFARELKDLEGQSLQLSSLGGRVLVINLWATWCGPCRMEIPELVKLHEEFSGRGVEFVGLTTEDPEEEGEKVRDFAAQFGVRYKLGWADRETAVALMAGRSSIPQTLVVAPDGHIAARFRGYSPRLPALMRAAIEKALEPAPPAAAAPPAETLPPPRP